MWDLEKDKDPDRVIELLSDKATVGTVIVAKNWNWFLFDDVGNPNKGYVQALQNRLSLISTKDFRHALVIVSDQAENARLDVSGDVVAGVSGNRNPPED